MSKHRTVHFVSLGCPKNRVDSEVMAGVAVEGGLRIVARPDEADVIVVNTCGFIGDAQEESVNAMLQMAEHRTGGRCSLLVATGCLSQLHGKEVAEAIPELDRVIGSDRPDQLMELIGSGADRINVSAPGHFLPRVDTPRFLEPGTISAYVKIGDGCSRKCAFCIIPSIRGKGRSRPVEEIVAEARYLADAGVREINLVAQDTSAYGADLGDGSDLVSLVEALDGVKGISWVRLLYLYPDAVPDRLFQAMGDLRTLVPYMDVPVQHSSAAMLRRMRRGHGPRALADLIGGARAAVPEIFLRTTVLVGHPGETGGDVDHLVSFIERSRFDHLGAFRYSDVEGTASHCMGQPVSGRDSYNRRRRVMAAQRRIVRQKNLEMMGRGISVLVEGVEDADGFVLVGRHGGQAPEVDGITYLVSSDAAPGDIVEARVIDSKDYDLVAEPI